MRTRMMAIIAAAFLPAAAQGQMKAHFINVGQAESILLEMPSAAVLVDAGGESTGDDRDREHLLAYLDQFFAGRPDLDSTLHSVIVSHPHLDHTRNLMPVLRRYRVRNLVDGGDQRGSGFPQLRQARRWAGENGVIYNRVPDNRVRASGYQPEMLRRVRVGSGVDIRFLAGSRPECADGNNGSLVLLVTYGEATFLLPGDTEWEDDDCVPGIERLLERFAGRIDVDVFKVSHHGSENGTSPELLTALTPEVAVISAGRHETHGPGSFHAWQFGHPRESVVSMVEAAASASRPAPAQVYTMTAVRQVRQPRTVSKAVYCTCWDGDVVVEVDSAGRSLVVRTGQN